MAAPPRGESAPRAEDRAGVRARREDRGDLPRPMGHSLIKLKVSYKSLNSRTFQRFL